MAGMSKTYTPELPSDVLQRLDEYAEHFRPEFNHARQTTWCGVYLHGLLADGERKSIEPMAGRLARRLDFQVTDPDQALQQFVNQSPWDEQKVGALPAGDAAVPARELAGGSRAVGQGRRARGRASPAEQGSDRPGVARPGARRGLAGTGRRGRCGVRRVPGLPRWAGAAGAALHRGRHRGDGGLHRGAAMDRAPLERAGPASHAPAPGRRLAPADEPEGAGRADALAESDLAGGDQGEALGAG